MPVTADTTIIAAALGGARSLARQMGRVTLGQSSTRGQLRDMARDLEKDLGEALEALKRVEAKGE